MNWRAWDTYEQNATYRWQALAWHERYNWRNVTTIVLMFASAAFIWFCTDAWAGEIEGRAKPIDGDGFYIEIRIFGIDAPERNQTCKDAKGADYPCGQIAAKELATMLKDKNVSCEKKDQDKVWGRPVAICMVDGNDVGAAMVDRGLAVAYRTYSDIYVVNEDRAKAAKLGLWGGTFEMPWVYRQRLKTSKSQHSQSIASSPDLCPPAKPFSPECSIKGNISGKKGKKRFYFIPGSISYDLVRITPSKGERYFCSEDEAVMCGWRKSP